MAQEDSIQTTGTIEAVVQSGKTYRAALANGHVVRAHIPERLRTNLTTLNPGDQVALELSPYDFSIARITSII
jgi:translation initiation factor IF-1